ncbi:MAG: glycosyltransferase family 4 protein [Candidatus Bathyarchaeia archaeon]
MMEIAVFVWEFPPRIVGGLGMYATKITQQFIKMGHDVTVFTLNPGDLPTRDVWSGVEVHRPLTIDISDSLPRLILEDLKKSGTNIKFFSNIFAYNILTASKMINDLVKKEDRDFDIVVAHDWLSVIGGMIAKDGLKKPMVFHIHSTEKGRAMGGGSQVVADLEYQGGQRGDIVVTVSHAMRDELIGQGFPEAKIRVCGNGIDPQKYDLEKVNPQDADEVRGRYGIRDTENMIFFIGRLVSVKGADRLVMAMPHVLRKVPNAKLVIVGLGDMQRYLVDLVKSLKLEASVKMRFEFISEEERILHYAASDLCVFPSLYEPFGIVALEAMSMGKPLVIGAAGVSGMRELVVPSGPDQCGFHINPYDPPDIAWGIINALANPATARRLGENGRKRVLEYYTWERAAENTIRVYEEVLANQASGR